MFEGDLTTLSTADLLVSAADHRAEANRADARLLVHAQIYADRSHPDVCSDRPGRTARDGRERAVVLGGEGCPEIAEFAVAEFGVMLGISPKVAMDYLGTALALRHRFPFTWARVQAGEATPWKACRIVAECSKLSEQAARYVDKRVAALVDSITPYRLEKIVKAAKFHADPERARAEADEKSRERGVFVGRSDEHGTKTMFIKAPSGAVIRHDATIAGIADALKIFGDTRPVQARRADAVGIIADPRYAQELLHQAHQHHVIQTAPDPAPTGPTTSTTTGSNTGVGVGDGTGCGADRRAPAGERRGPANHNTRPDGEFGRCESQGEEGLLADWADGWGEPGPDDEADRDAPHPSASDLPEPLDAPFAEPVEPFDASLRITSDRIDHVGRDPVGGEPMDAAAQRALDARLARIKHQAHTNPTTRDGADRLGGRLRPGKTEIYVHLTDHTLATGTGVLRAEGIGPMLADQLTELIGHGPYTVKPVIDLNDAVSVDAYEIPDRIRERVKLINPVEVFPYGTRETRQTIDLDHIQPYDPLGPPGQTNTANLAPLGRFTHRVKTHARGWKVRRIDYRTIEWTTPHGFTFHVTPTGTHRVQAPHTPPDCPT